MGVEDFSSCNHFIPINQGREGEFQGEGGFQFFWWFHSSGLNSYNYKQLQNPACLADRLEAALHCRKTTLSGPPHCRTLQSQTRWHSTIRCVKSIRQFRYFLPQRMHQIFLLSGHAYVCECVSFGHVSLITPCISDECNSFGIVLLCRDETGLMRNWLKYSETSCNVNIFKKRLFQSSKDPYPQCRETFSHLIYADLKDEKFGSELAKISQLAAQSHPCSVCLSVSLSWPNEHTLWHTDFNFGM